ncbi:MULTISPECIES: hypothetical protein [Methylobacterium]|uniref:hypothetical protein n=1 Tax=Methylobacterium TaxID=407 RepID=UPI0019D2CEF0|nr:hypothetical protein [Methylobacterium sp. DB0501]
MLLGRLGLDTARVPHGDRHGLLWLDRGRLEVEDGCLRFVTRAGPEGARPSRRATTRSRTSRSRRCCSARAPR